MECIAINRRQLSGARGAALAVCVSLAGCLNTPDSPRPENPACIPGAGFVPICGVVAPEDMVRAPGGRHIIFSQLDGPGGLHLLRPESQRIEALFAGAADVSERHAGWGDADCPAPDRPLHAHGIDLHRLADGRWRLLAVNHAGRESVEFLELRQEGGQAPLLQWRGCALAPEDGNFNDVAGLADGGFLVTHMGSRSRQTRDALLARLGVRTGHVYHWRPDEGFGEVAGTRTRFPNGLILSHDEKTLYLNEYFGDRTLVMDWRNGARQGEISVEKPDNLSWTTDGELLIASHHAGLLALARSLETAPDRVSLLPYSIVAVDPDTLESRTLLRHAGPPMGAGTVALDSQGRLYIGSYRGDRIVYTDMPAGSPR